MKKSIQLKSLALAGLLLCQTEAFAANSPKREMRSTWFTTVWAIDWPSNRGTSASIQTKQKAELDTYINNFESLNLNGICFQVRGMADAFYTSTLEPWSSSISGTRGVSPGWDPLKYAVEKCHSKGLECYAWVNPFRHSTGTTVNTSTAKDKKWKDDGWLLHYDSYTVFNPAVPGARQHILAVIEEIIDNYAIDGILFDDYFYPNNIPEDDTAEDWDLYKASGTSLSIGDWRRQNINTMVEDIQKLIVSKRPDLRFGISPAGVAGASASKYGLSKPAVSSSDWQYGTIYSDPLAWLNDGSIDFISPQIYWLTTNKTAPYEPLAKWWSDVADHFGRHFYSSHSLSVLTDANTDSNRADFVKQIDLNRKYATDVSSCGSLFYSSKHFKTLSNGTIGQQIIDESFTNKSLVPVITWRNGRQYDAPSNVNLSNGKLSWNSVSNTGNAIIRYTVYAVPENLSYEKAMNVDGDGIDNEYLLGVTYSTSYSLPADKTSGYWYAIHVYDGYGREHTPAFVGYSVKELETPQLQTPADGAQVSWKNQDFSWISNTQAKYILEISEFKDFSKIVVSQTTEQKNISVDLNALDPEKTYFWRVSATESGALPAISETRSFTTSAYQQLEAATLISPIDGAEVEDVFVFSWQKVDGAQTYTLQVSDTKDFAKIKYVRELTDNYFEAVSSLFGIGNHYWRIISSGECMLSSTSKVESFIVSRIDIGAYEPGYVVKREEFDYPLVDDYKIENLWIRSINQPFGNIDFPDAGTYSRGMVANEGIVYVCRRSENSSKAKLYLDCYNGETGELIKSLLLTNKDGDAQISYFPMNNIAKDSHGNIVIFNLTLNAATVPLVMHSVDVETGNLTKIASVNTAASSRIDHASVWGNIAEGNYTIFGAGATSAKTITRWTFENGVLSKTLTSAVNSYEPSEGGNFGIAPRVFPLSDNEVLVNGGGIHPSHYALTNKSSSLKYGVSAFGEDNAPLSTEANGVCQFKFNNEVFTLYPHATCTQPLGYQFMVVKTSDDKYSNPNRIAVFPTNGLGKVNSQTMSTPVDAEVSKDGKSARMYVYAVGNGLAAYQLYNKKTDAVGDIYNESFAPVVFGSYGCININAIVDDVEVYSMDGKLLVKAHNCNRVDIASGMYVVKTGGFISKVIVR